MAKKKKKKAMSVHRVWQAEPDDAIRLAALRWFALEVERVSIEIYATDKTQYFALERVFRAALSKLSGVKKDLAEVGEGECPEGFILCKDGVCAPMCDGIVDSNNQD